MTQMLSSKIYSADLRLAVLGAALTALITVVGASHVAINTIKEERFLKVAELIGNERSNARSTGIIIMGQVVRGCLESINRHQ
jgi:hypothetical protein